MVNLTFSNADRSVEVTYKTDLLSNNSDGKFTVMQIVSLDPEDEVAGFNFTEEQNNLGAFKQFAIDNGYQLERNDGKSSDILVEL